MSTQQDIYAASSENRPPMLNKDNYVPCLSRLLRYAKSRPNGKLIYNSIMNGPYVRRMIHESGDLTRTVHVPETFHEQTDDELTKAEIKQTEADDQVIQTILLGLPEDIYAAVDSYKKAKLFNEWERFTSTDGELIESYYHRFSKLMSDFKRNKHFPEKIANYTQLYDFLKYNQKEVDELRAERLAKTQDPLALVAISNNPFNYPLFHPDLPSSSTFIQQPLPNNNYIPQPSFNHNYMQQPMPNPKEITDPITAMNMALVLMAKMVGGNGANQNRNGNVVAARAERNANENNGNQIRCYNCRGLGHLARNYTVRPRIRGASYLQTQLFIAQKEEAGIQLQADEFDLMVAATDLDEIEEVNANCILMANLQQASTSGTQSNMAPVYDSDGLAE
ncbi:hypothetical protein Tco_0618092, partial [Tanacetum coccineum]